MYLFLQDQIHFEQGHFVSDHIQGLQSV